MNKAEASLIENLGDITAEIVRVQAELNKSLKENIELLKQNAQLQVDNEYWKRIADMALN